MPYPMERASRLGHVPVVNSQAVRDAFSRWQVAQAAPSDVGLVASMCHTLESLPHAQASADVRFAITVDGSDTEVEATREHPTVKVGYVRVAASFIDLSKLHASGVGEFVDPTLLREAHKHAAFDGALPGSGLVMPGRTGVDTWRQELDKLLATTKFDDESPLTLADMLLALHGTPDAAAVSISLRRCPTCGNKDDQLPGGAITVPKAGTICPACSAPVFLGDALRTHEEYLPEGSNQSALTRVMLVAERLTSLGYMQVLHRDPHGADAMRRTLFITDGPLALHGVVAPLKRRFQDYLGAMTTAAAASGRPATPLVVGVEKSGRFVEHADIIKHLIPEGSVMALSSDYINRITGRPAEHQYGVDEFYGRRFIYRTQSGSALVITVPPSTGIAPYGTPAGEDIASYPTLRPICEVLDRVQTRLYPNAVIPVALAHSAASLPLGVGQSVLRAMGQDLLGLRRTSQIVQRGPFPGGGAR
ncbi:hypothetical protein FB00_13490 [Cellulosimicrobium funkei]|uniref:NurA domain-containing protein n=1 Tax=Cellulosimicrobium funkei TaxID=264251 RepID=A0A0H2KL47_9MICO|nr:hypothetical protein [Cellulosimicrobium funkei]KLN34186.1 hypothetical protein FB00_13490 [Cellulosimicrobium funkei]